MILVLRIAGLVEIDQDLEEAFRRIHLHRKYTATFLEDTPANKALLQKLRNCIAFGIPDKALITELITQRGKGIANKKFDAAKVVEQFGKKSLQDLGVKPFFALHPPCGGIDSKVHYPMRKGVLGDHHDKIGVLIRRML